MNKRLRWLVFLSSLFLVVTLITGLGMLSAGLRTRVQCLPDGTRLTLAGVTYGRQHQIVRGTWWQKLLNPLLSNEWRNRFGMMFPQHQSAGSNALVFWTLRDLPAQSPTRGLSSWEARGVTFDEAGHEGETAVRVQGAGAFYGPPVLEAWEVAAFPRRGRSVGLRLYTRPPGGDWNPAAEFVTGNPSPGPHPTWTPQPLPSTRRQRDIAFTLTRFRTGVSAPGGSRLSSAVETWTEATFQVTEKGKPSTAWEPADVIVSDATGNSWKPSVCLHDWKDGEARLFFRGALWQGEPAWKLRVEFVPGAPSDPNALWTVRGAAVPPPGVFARSTARVARNGVTLRLLGISAAGAQARAPIGLSLTPETPTAFVRLSPPPGVRLRLARATDEQGRGCARSRPQGGFVGQYSFRLLPPPGAKRLDLSFAVHRQSHTVDFVVAPARAAAITPALPRAPMRSGTAHGS